MREIVTNYKKNDESLIAKYDVMSGTDKKVENPICA